MIKEYLEAFGLIKRTCEIYMETTRFLKGSDIIANQIKEALNTIQNRLESIDNANPSEALECVERIGAEKLARGELIRNDDKVEPYLNTIKQALIKAEKEHKALETIKEKCVDVFRINYYITSNRIIELEEYKRDRNLTEEELELLKEVLE